MIFELLCERVYDKTPSSRNAVIKVFNSLFRELNLPLEYQLKMGQISIDRIFDVGHFVRKKSLSTLSAVMFHFKDQIKGYREITQSVEQLNNQQELSFDQKGLLANQKITLEILELIKSSHNKI